MISSLGGKGVEGKRILLVTIVVEKQKEFILRKKNFSTSRSLDLLREKSILRCEITFRDHKNLQRRTRKKNN
jgi:hypothetical protein